MEINKTTIKEFEKLLIELGGFHELRDNGTIYRVSDGEQIAVPVGKQNLPIVRRRYACWIRCGVLESLQRDYGS